MIKFKHVYVTTPLVLIVISIVAIYLWGSIYETTMNNKEKSYKAILKKNAAIKIIGSEDFPEKIDKNELTQEIKKAQAEVINEIQEYNSLYRPHINTCPNNVCTKNFLLTQARHQLQIESNKSTLDLIPHKESFIFTLIITFLTAFTVRSAMNIVDYIFKKSSNH